MAGKGWNVNKVWVIRILLPGGSVWLASRTEPSVEQLSGELLRLNWTPDPDDTRTLAYIDWDAVQAITWAELDQVGTVRSLDLTKLGV